MTTLINIENLSTDAAEKIAEILIADSEEDAALIILQEHGERVFVASVEGADVEYDYVDTKYEAAAEYVSEGDWGDRTKTQWEGVRVIERWRLGNIEIDADDSSVRAEIPPEEPPCAKGHKHDWCSPFAVLGGLKENPGVWGHGGGVVSREVCRHCGCLRTSDSWAQDPETGEQGLYSVEYDSGDHRYRDAWEEWSAEREND